MHVLRALLRRVGAAQLLVQLSVRRLHNVRRTRDTLGGRSRARRPGLGAVRQRRGHRTLGAPQSRVLVPGPPGRGRGARLRPRHTLEEAHEEGTRHPPRGLGRVDLRQVQEPVREAARVLDHVRGHPAQHRTTAPRDGVRCRSARSSSSSCARSPAAHAKASVSGRRRWPSRSAGRNIADLTGPVDPRRPRLHRRHAVSRTRAHDRGAAR